MPQQQVEQIDPMAESAETTVRAATLRQESHTKHTFHLLKVNQHQANSYLSSLTF